MFSHLLSKCLPLLVMPLGLSLVVLGYALRRPSRAIVGLAAAILLFCSTPVVSERLMRTLEDRYDAKEARSYPPVDAIFVFGGMLGPRAAGTTAVAWNEAADRFERAVWLFQSGKAPVLVFSGGAETYPGGPDEGQLLLREAETRGIPVHAIRVTSPTANTEDEGNALRRMVIGNGWKRVLLVTSAYHMPRAMTLTAACPAERIPVPVAFETPSPGTGWAFERPESYLPQGHALAMSEKALREYLGIAVYRLFHRNAG